MLIANSSYFGLVKAKLETLNTSCVVIAVPRPQVTAHPPRPPFTAWPSPLTSSPPPFSNGILSRPVALGKLSHGHRGRLGTIFKLFPCQLTTYNHKTAVINVTWPTWAIYLILIETQRLFGANSVE